MSELTTCRRCQKSGSSLDEFTSPHTGLCAECERYAAAAESAKAIEGSAGLAALALSVATVARSMNLALSACKAALEYDAAIKACGDDPAKMASFCTANGDDLDRLYERWQTKAKAVIDLCGNWLDEHD